MRLALDAMGGDNAPAAPVAGAVLHARATGDEVVLVGRPDPIVAELSRHDTSGLRLPVHPASEQVGMDEHAAATIRRKKDSSMRVALELHKRGEVAAVMSAGHSGALMAGALLVLGRLPHVERPCFAALIPTLRGQAVLCDVGANTQCRPVHLAQFALMGEAYAKALLGIDSPRLGVIANGEEDSKGTALTRSTLDLLRKLGRRAAHVEGKDLLMGEVDVLCTDGFTGNVVLKTMEGVVRALATFAKEEVERSRRAQAGMLLVKPALDRLRSRLSYEEQGGAPLLGIDGVVVVAHGRSTDYACKQALAQAARAAQVDLKAALASAAGQVRKDLVESGNRASQTPRSQS